MEIIDLGLQPYRQVWAMQLEAQKEVIDAPARERIYLVEHPHVYTLGRHGNPHNMIHLPADTELIQIERGGDITYHGPGQLVVYPIIHLPSHHIGVKEYVNRLEQAVIDTIAEYGVVGERVEGATGVWIDVGSPAERKICAIGVKISHGTTMHGLALNVNTDLSRFSAINPCGFIDKGVTSLSVETGSGCNLSEVKQKISAHLRRLLS
ncbi:MAG: lipoyl(octanoyl) transferase LipB [Muribaculaceae bacterium]|nr:lipoyl(octanoyl) transferase LipB [Muribaculaceae bacterium]